MLSFSNLDERIKFWKNKDRNGNEHWLRADISNDLEADIDAILKGARVKREVRDKVRGLVADMVTVSSIDLT